jgi:hypothetical protein
MSVYNFVFIDESICEKKTRYSLKYITKDFEYTDRYSIVTDDPIQILEWLEGRITLNSWEIYFDQVVGSPIYDIIWRRWGPVVTRRQDRSRFHYIEYIARQKNN